MTDVHDVIDSRSLALRRASCRSVWATVASVVQVSVIIDNFNKMKRQNNGKDILMTETQKRWMDSQVKLDDTRRDCCADIEFGSRNG